MDFLTHIDREWSVISAAPFTFIAGIILAGIIIWVAVRAIYLSEIRSLEARLKLRDDEIADYKRKLNVGSPDEAKDRIDRLEREVSLLHGRHVTKAQAEAIRREASAANGRIRIMSDPSASDSGTYVGQLQDAFKDAGWSVEGGQIMGSGAPSKYGMIVTFHPTIAQACRQALTMAFAKAGIDAEFNDGEVAGTYVDVHIRVGRIASS